MLDQEENGDIEKMIYPTRLISLALPSKSRQAPTREAISSGYPPEELNRSNLVKLELSDGQTLYSKLVVIAYHLLLHLFKLLSLSIAFSCLLKCMVAGGS